MTATPTTREGGPLQTHLVKSTKRRLLHGAGMPERIVTGSASLCAMSGRSIRRSWIRRRLHVIGLGGVLLNVIELPIVARDHIRRRLGAQLPWECRWRRGRHPSVVIDSAI